MSLRVIISGGGTGGHIFPALSIGNELKSRDSKTEILFVGAKGGMEMSLVPKNNFQIEGVWISGILRSMKPQSILRNLSFPVKLLTSLFQSREIINRFKPDVVVGVGGYASGPLGRAAAAQGIPLVLCEQNAYPGITNKWLASRAKVILLGNAAAQKHFSAFPTKITGNPVRANLKNGNRESGFKFFNLDANKPIVLSLGGSLGASTLNWALESNLLKFPEAGVQLIWQCGKRYFDEIQTRVKDVPGVHIFPFIDNMADAFAVSDLVISRAGGSTISELIMLSKPSILVPSPNVAEDHQTQNALSLVNQEAALLVKDIEANEKLVEVTLGLLKDTEKFSKLSAAIKAVEKYDSAKEIVDEIIHYAKIK